APPSLAWYGPGSHPVPVSVIPRQRPVSAQRRLLAPNDTRCECCGRLSSQLLESALEHCSADLPFRIGFGKRHQHAHPPHPVGLLRLRRERPRSRAAEERDERAPGRHSITSSARASSIGGTPMPSALAVLRLITSSYLVGCWTGRLAGFSPLR